MKKSKNNNIVLGFGYWVLNLVLVDAKERSLSTKIKVFNFFFQFLAVMDLIFLVILIIRDGIFYGIVVHGRPSWFKLVFPFGIYPMFFMFRFCTSYMLVVISIERCIALSNALVYKSRCHSYILLVVFYTSELPNLCNL